MFAFVFSSKLRCLVSLISDKTTHFGIQRWYIQPLYTPYYTYLPTKIIIQINILIIGLTNLIKLISMFIAQPIDRFPYHKINAKKNEWMQKECHRFYPWNRINFRNWSNGKKNIFGNHWKTIETQQENPKPIVWWQKRFSNTTRKTIKSYGLMNMR